MQVNLAPATARGEGERHALVAWPALVIALDYLLARCDGAIAEDDVGFSKPDAGKARALGRNAAYWTEDEARTAADMLLRYKRQLSAGGLYEGVLNWRVNSAQRKVTLQGDLAPVAWDRAVGALSINLSPRDEAARERIKAVPGRRWDPEAKVWRVVPGADTAAAITAALAASRLTVPFEVTDRLARVADAGSHGWLIPQSDGSVVISVEETARRTLSACCARVPSRELVASVHMSRDEVASNRSSLAVLGLLDGDTLTYAIEAPGVASPGQLLTGAEEWDGIRLDPTGPSVLIRHEPFDAELVTAIKELPARKWDRDRKLWTVAASANTWPQLMEIARRFGLTVDPSVEERAVKHAETAAILEATSNVAAPSDLHVPGLALKLFPFQASGVEYAVRARRTFIADEMGLGKTVQALAAASVVGTQRLMVLCEANVRVNWAREVKHCFPGWQPVIVAHTSPSAVDETLATVDPKGGPVVLVAGYPLLQNAKTAAANLRSITEWDPDGLVCDESHNLKTSARDSARTAGALAIAKSLMARHEDAPIYLLSGTPMPNKPKELFSQLEIMGRVNDFGGWQNFARAYCGLHYETGHGGKLFPAWDGVTNPADLNRKLRSTCMVRRHKADVTPELGQLLDADRPPIYIETDQEAMEVYKATERSVSGLLAQRAVEIANELGVSVDSAAVADRLRRIEAAASLVKLNELRKLAARAKLPQAIAWIGEAVESSRGQGMHLLDGGGPTQPGKVIVFAHHQEVVQAIADAFSAPQISGLETGMAERQEVIDRFQRDPETRLVVCSFGAGAQGITLTAASQVIFVELPWRPMDVDQAIARAWRIGQTQVVTPTFLLAADTVDEDMLSLIRQKAGDFEAVIEGGLNGGPKGRSIEGELVVRLARKGSAESTTPPARREFRRTDYAAKAGYERRVQVPSHLEGTRALPIPQSLPLEAALPAAAVTPATAAAPATRQIAPVSSRSFRGRDTRFDR